MDMWEQSVDPGGWDGVDKRPVKPPHIDLGDFAANTLNGDERSPGAPTQRGPK